MEICVRRIKIITAVSLSFLLLLPLLASCASNGYGDEEVFAARAAYAISRHIGDATSFVISYIEYSESDGDVRVTADCALYYTGSDFERYVYAVGTGKYFEDKTAEGKGVYDKETGLYLLNFGDTLFNKNEENKLNEKKILELFNKFIKSGDKALLGID